MAIGSLLQTFTLHFSPFHLAIASTRRSAHLFIVFYDFPANIVSEETILKWFKDGHSQKGKMHFLDQMKKFIEWLQNAEEESDSEEED